MEVDSNSVIKLYSEIILPFNPRILENSRLLDIIGNKNYVCYSEQTKLFNQADHVFQGRVKDGSVDELARKLIDAYNSMGYRRPNFELINYEEHFPIKKDYIIDDAGGAYLLTKGVSDSEASNFIDSISLRGSKVRWRNAEKSKYNP